jgi:Putative cyclase
MKRLVAGIGIMICAIVVFIVWSVTVQAQITQTVVQKSLSERAAIAQNVAQKSPWGSADEIGTLNLMTDASRLDVLKQVANGKVYDLGVDLFVGMPSCCDSFKDPPFQIWMTHTPARGTNKELLSYSGDGISMYTHTGTHLDSLNHFGLHGQIWNQVKADDALGVRGWSKSGVDKYPPIVARGTH